MRRRTIFERADHAGEVSVDFRARVAGDFERLVHDVGAVVADRARREFDPIADNVILPREDVERVHILKRVHPALRHREGVVAEVDLLGLLVIVIHREIDDPAEAEGVFFDQVEGFGDAGARRSC